MREEDEVREFRKDVKGSSIVDVDGEPVVQLNLDSHIQQELSNATPRERGEIVEEYLRAAVAKVGSYTFHDGTEAIMDNGDISKIGHTKYEVKNRTAVSMDDIVKVARLYAEDHNIEHKKFSFFKYYSAKVRVGENLYSMTVNVGFGKYDSTYHIYDINQFDLSNKKGSGSPVLSNPRKSVDQTVSRATTPTNNISHPGDSVNRENAEILRGDSDQVKQSRKPKAKKPANEHAFDDAVARMVFLKQNLF
jgi:hypothetical protein